MAEVETQGSSHAAEGSSHADEGHDQMAGADSASELTAPATTHHPFRGSFSAVSTPIVMRNGAFFSIFQNLQEFALFS